MAIAIANAITVDDVVGEGEAVAVAVAIAIANAITVDDVVGEGEAVAVAVAVAIANAITVDASLPKCLCFLILVVKLYLRIENNCKTRRILSFLYSTKKYCTFSL